jgi:hypothetical protein
VLISPKKARHVISFDGENESCNAQNNIAVMGTSISTQN